MRRANMAPYLERLRYEPAERGPLMVVGPPQNALIKRDLPDPDAPGPTPLMLADAFDMRVFKAGNVTVIAPREMTVINARPGKPNIWLNLRPDEQLKALLSSLSDAQWEQAGKAGLSPSDFTEQQAGLVQALWPQVTRVRKQFRTPNPDRPGSYSTSIEIETTAVDARQIRLRLSRAAQYFFRRVGQERATFPILEDRVAGNGVVYQGADPPSTKDSATAYGVKLLNVVPNRLKPSEITFDDPIWDHLVPLQKADGAALETVGDLLREVSRATRLDIRADKRVAVLPLVLRAQQGQTARAGDVLMALSYGVTGAYRRLGPRLFLLSDDMEGIGTRFARLSAWASGPLQESYDTIEQQAREARKRNPARLLPFEAAGGALPPAVARKIEGVLAKDPYSFGAVFSSSELSGLLRQEVEEARQEQESSPSTETFSRDTITIGMRLQAQWVLPNGGVLQDTRTGNLHPQFLAALLPEPPRPAPAKAAPKTRLPAALPRRVVAIYPRTAGEARQLIQAATAAAFTEVWVRQTLGSDDFTVLQAAIKAGAAAKVPVVALPALLWASVGEPERTITGQNGDEWIESRAASALYQLHPEWKDEGVREAELYRSWVYPSDAEETLLLKRLSALAKLPGLAGLCLTHTTPPGYNNQQGGDGIPTGGQMGYTLAMRRQFLDKEGFDPIDIVQTPDSLDIDKELPFFPSNSHSLQRLLTIPGHGTEYAPLARLWGRFQEQQTDARLRRVYAILRAAQPKLPLYLQDRVSEYTEPHTAWFGSWEVAGSLPRNQVYLNEADMDAAVRTMHKTRVLRQGWIPGGWRGQAYRFAEAVARTRKPGQWQGIAVDLTPLDAAEALKVMGSLSASPPIRPASR